jgi:hypothetical protein
MAASGYIGTVSETVKAAPSSHGNRIEESFSNDVIKSSLAKVSQLLEGFWNNNKFI